MKSTTMPIIPLPAILLDKASVRSSPPGMPAKMAQPMKDRCMQKYLALLPVMIRLLSAMQSMTPISG